MSSRNERVRNWNIVVYPESAPDNWRSVFDDLHIPWIESPLHCNDICANGELKKPHYHVTLLFSGSKSYEQVKELTDSLNCPIPQICHDTRGSVRYMTHMDNPEKAQYKTSEIIGHGGADPYEYVDLLKTRVKEVTREIILFCKDNGVTEFSDLVEYCLLNGEDDWYNVAMHYATLSIKTYINSARHREKQRFY